MELRPPAVRELLERLERLPGIGPRSARRLVEHLLTASRDEVRHLAAALEAVRERVILCSTCFLLTETDPCPVCTDAGRDRTTILVVASPTAAWAVESTGEYRGLYHALLGQLSPLHGVGPEELTVDALVERVRAGGVREVILATDATVEGETTALYVARLLRPLGVTASRPAAGIPVGGDLASVDEVTLGQALQLRRRLE